MSFQYRTIEIEIQDMRKKKKIRFLSQLLSIRNCEIEQQWQLWENCTFQKGAMWLKIE